MKLENKQLKWSVYNKSCSGKKNSQISKILADPKLIATLYNYMQFSKHFTPNKINLIKIQVLIKQFMKGVFFSKKGVFGLKNRIFLKLVEVILILIYEPLFETLNCNFGKRCFKTPKTAFKALISKNINTKVAIKGEILSKKIAQINPIIMLKILRKKISDFKFLNLIKTILKNIEQFPKNSLNFVLFNIYFHEFDLYIWNKIKKANMINKITYYWSDFVKDSSFRLYNIKQKCNTSKITNKVERFNIKDFQIIQNKAKRCKKEQIKTVINKKKLTESLIYNRYYNHWVLMMIWENNKVLKLKKALSLWLSQNLKIKWYFKKLICKNLEKSKLNYLGFSIKLMPFKTRRVEYKNKLNARRKSSKFLFVGINHTYLRNKLFKNKVITSFNKPQHVPKYCSLKPLEIIKKFSQKLKTIVKYYYSLLSIPSNLSYYYYVHKFSCLKTLAYQMKKSIKYIYTFYFQKLNVITNFFSRIFIAKKTKKYLNKRI